MPRGYFTGRCIQPPHVVARNRRYVEGLGLPWLEAMPEREGRIAVVGGGPSAHDFLEEILAFDGPIMAVNGAYNWLAEAGRVADFMVMGDPDDAPEMAAFVANPRPGTRFLIASSVHRSVLDALAGHDVVAWRDAHGSEGIAEGAIPGGSSTLTRAPILCIWMGWRDIVLYGADGCYQTSTSHAYGGQVRPERLFCVVVAGREFVTEPALLMQSEHLSELIPALDGIQIEVRGDHLLSALIGNEWEFAEVEAARVSGAYVPPGSRAHALDALRITR